MKQKSLACNSFIETYCLKTLQRNSKFHKKNVEQHYMSHDMWFPTMWHFDKVDSDEHVQPPLKQKNSKWCLVSSLTVIEYSSD